MVAIQKKVNQVISYTQNMVPLKSDKTYNIIIQTISVFLVFILWNYHLFEGAGHGILKKSVMILFIILGIIGIRVYKPVEKKIDLKFLVVWMILGLAQFITAFTVSKEYLIFAFIWTIGYPIFFFFWSGKEEFSKLMFSLATAIEVVFIVMTMLAILLVPITIKYQYNGFTRNPNSFGEQLIAAFPAIIYLYYCAKSKISKRLHFLLICVVIAFAFFTRSRTALLSILGMLICTAFIYLIREKKKLKFFIQMIIGLIIGIVFSIVVLFGINRASLMVIDNHNESVLTFLSPGFSEDYYFKDIKGQKKNENLNDIFNAYAKRVSVSDRNINAYSSGRVEIWKKALDLFKWNGNSSKVHIYTDQDKGSDTHNTTLQFIFNFGYLAGICYVLLIVTNFIFLLYKSIKEKANVFVFLILANVGYLLSTQFSSMISPFYYLITFVFYFTFIPNFYKTEKDSL